MRTIAAAWMVRSAIGAMIVVGTCGCESESGSGHAGATHSAPIANSGSTHRAEAPSTSVVITDVVVPKMSTSPVLNRVSRPSGVVIEELKIGDGKIVFPGAVITFRHRGFVKSTGACYEDSYLNAEAIEVPLNETPRSMKEGIPGMRVGGIRRLVVPSAMSFGPRGLTDEETGQVLVGPDEVTVYEIELLGIKQVLPGEADADVSK